MNGCVCAWHGIQCWCLAMQHIFLRLYASVHLILMYGVSVSLLPAVGSPLRHLLPDGVLDTLGLLHPSTTNSMLPVLSLLLLVQRSISNLLKVSLEDCYGRAHGEVHYWAFHCGML